MLNIWYGRLSSAISFFHSLSLEFKSGISFRTNYQGAFSKSYEIYLSQIFSIFNSTRVTLFALAYLSRIVFFCPDRNKSTWVNLSSFLLVSINYKCRKDRLTLTGHHYSWFVQADLLSFYLQIPTLDFSYKILVDSMWTFLRIKLWILLDIMQRIP